jgi:hypothetical protein
LLDLVELFFHGLEFFSTEWHSAGGHSATDAYSSMGNRRIDVKGTSENLMRSGESLLCLRSRTRSATPCYFRYMRANSPKDCARVRIGVDRPEVGRIELGSFGSLLLALLFQSYLGLSGNLLERFRLVHSQVG